MQLFVLLYIEGGSYIQEDEETWEFAVLYVSVLSLHYACWN
jgi:histone acetyltransferase 1